MINRLLATFLRTLVGCMVVLLVPTAVSAQESTPTAADLIVTVRDVHGAPLADLSVQLRAGVDTPVLSEARTDARGQAVFAMISVSQVRVRVTGVLASGPRLYQPGADSPGVAVFLGPPPTTLDLRVDSDGMVLPDPVSMIDPVPYGPAIATPAPSPDGNGRIVFPTSATYAARLVPTVAAFATTLPVTSTLLTSLALVAPPMEAGAHSAAPASPTHRWWVVGIGGALVLVVGGLLVLTSRGRRHP